MADEIKPHSQIKLAKRDTDGGASRISYWFDGLPSLDPEVLKGCYGDD